MLNLARWSRIRACLRLATKCQSRRHTTTAVDRGEPFEEERLPWYKHDQFYPVRIGQLLDSRYMVLGKLGYGSQSTSWLCRDTSEAKYVTVKVCTRDSQNSARIRRELKFYEHLISLGSNHIGQAFIRGLLGTFEMAGSGGKHLCLVHPPMHMTIRELQYKNPSHKLNETLLKWTLLNLLQALSFLHEEANVVHSDINVSNIMMTLDDETILDDFAQDEASEPSPSKRIDDLRTIYGTRKLRLPRDAQYGQPILCDFGETRIGISHKGLIQPEIYRAPEVLFDMQWGTTVDMWNLAALIWDLLENKHLFNALDEQGESSATHHVAEMVGYLGLPPPEYIARSDETLNVFDREGRWDGAGTPIPQGSLEDAVTSLNGASKEQFLAFVRRMLQWLPEERATASEMLKHPFLGNWRDNL